MTLIRSQTFAQRTRLYEGGTFAKLDVRATLHQNVKVTVKYISVLSTRSSQNDYGFDLFQPNMKKKEREVKFVLFNSWNSVSG